MKRAKRHPNITHTTTTLSEPRFNLAATSSGELVFFAGGCRSTNPRKPSDRVDIYNVTSGSWTTTTLSIPRAELAATSSQNLVFFAGGRRKSTLSNQVDIYNTLNGSWSTAPLSQPRSYLASTSVGNLVLFGGGFDSTTGPSDVVDVFDVTSNTWTTTTLSQARWWISATSIDNRYALFGGGTSLTGPSNVVDIFDSLSGMWSTTTLSQARAGLASTSLGNLAFFGGGQTNGSKPSKVVDIFNSTTQTWSTSTLSQARYQLAATSIRDIVAFGGGYTGSKLSSTVNFFDLSTKTWFYDKLSQPRRLLAATSLGNKIFFGGGGARLKANEVSNVVDIFEYTGKSSNMLIPEDQEDTKLEDEESERSIDEEKSTVESKEPLTSDDEKFKIPISDLVVSQESKNSGQDVLILKGKYKDQVVAVKHWISKPHVDISEEFNKECNIMKILDHKNIVKFLGYVGSPHFYIVMEYYQEGSLYDLLHKNKIPLSQNQQFQYALGIAEGMEYLHSRNPPIIHRDLKSLNVMLSGNIPKIIDFGISKQGTTSLTFSSTIQGTLNWMAPEAWRGCHITEKVDVWAFGMILYELVTNTIPYQDLDTEESVKNEVCVQKKTPPIPEGIEVHPTLLDLMKKCWNWDPEQRPSFTEIVQTLEKTIMNVPKANEKFN